MKIDFESPDGSVIANEEFSGPIVASEWTTIEGVSGVRFKTWKYEDVSEEKVDGSLIEFMPGSMTKPQYVETDHVFDENIQQGKFLLFHITQEGLSVYKYDSSIEEVSFSLQVHQGELMCLYALKDNDQPGEIIECEKPGFSLAKLVTVPDGAEKIGDLEIPPEFWQARKMLKEGIEDDLLVDILDMNEEMMEPELKVAKIADKAILEIMSLFQAPFGDFLESYEEAEDIAEEIVKTQTRVDRKDLERRVVEIIKEKASLSGLALEGIDTSLEAGTLNDDFPSCKDFIDFVLLAVEEAGGKVVEEKVPPLEQVDSLWAELDFIDLKEGRNLQEADLALIEALTQLPKEIALDHHNYFSLNGDRCLATIDKDIARTLERLEQAKEVTYQEKLQALKTYLEIQKKIIEKYDWQTAWNVNVVLERRKKKPINRP